MGIDSCLEQRASRSISEGRPHITWGRTSTLKCSVTIDAGDALQDIKCQANARAMQGNQDTIHKSAAQGWGVQQVRDMT